MAIFDFEWITFSTETKNPLVKEEIIEESRGDISEYTLELDFGGKIYPTEYKILWELDQIDTVGFWSPKHHFISNITPDWGKRESISKLTNGMPLAALYGLGDKNALTISLSDAKNAIIIKAGVIEETGKIGYEIVFFPERTSQMSGYKVKIRLDRRKLPFYKTVEAVKLWWQEIGYKPSYEPKDASAPLYSAWYSFHQRTIPDEIVYECKIAKEFGMDTVIVDDGWQTDDNSRGYGYCGDWEVCKKKIPDMKNFVDRIHELDMKFMLWFSVPFVGYFSKNYERFKGMYLRQRDPMDAMILDPRFKEVRDFITEKYVEFVKEYGIDGLKLDFIDSFYLEEMSSTEYDKMDTSSVEDAVEMLLMEISQKLKSINPEFLIEFRQSYTGPVIGQYGNMFRVTDCPADPYVNRVHGLTMRISQDGIIHSDMMMWNKDEKNEAVAYQLLATMFSVPQISIRFDNITSDHKKILKNYLDFWRAHRDTILKGEMEYFDVQANFSCAKSTKNGETVSVLYQSIVDKASSDTTNYIFNATGKSYIYLETEKESSYEAYDIFGILKEKGKIEKGVSKISVPSCGMVKLN